MGGQSEIFSQPDGTAVGDFADILESKPPQIIEHPGGMDFGHDDSGCRREQLFQRRAVEMIRMKVRQVDVVWLQISNQFGGRLWKIPPASPVAGADQPRVGDDPHTLVLHTKASMA